MSEELHNVVITDTQVRCSCGYEFDTDLPPEARKLGYIHAQMQLASKVDNQQTPDPDGY